MCWSVYRLYKLVLLPTFSRLPNFLHVSTKDVLFFHNHLRSLGLRILRQYPRNISTHRKESLWRIRASCLGPSRKRPLSHGSQLLPPEDPCSQLHRHQPRRPRPLARQPSPVLFCGELRFRLHLDGRNGIGNVRENSHLPESARVLNLREKIWLSDCWVLQYELFPRTRA